MAETPKTRRDRGRGGEVPGRAPRPTSRQHHLLQTGPNGSGCREHPPPGGDGGRRGEFWAARVVTGGDVCPQLRTGEVRKGL